LKIGYPVPCNKGAQKKRLFCHQKLQIVRDFGLYTKFQRTRLGVCPYMVRMSTCAEIKKASVKAGF
jgi:hypothetical protein